MLSPFVADGPYTSDPEKTGEQLAASNPRAGYRLSGVLRANVSDALEIVR
jgi:hypothetical protein